MLNGASLMFFYFAKCLVGSYHYLNVLSFLNLALMHLLKIHNQSKVKRDVVFGSLETTMCRPETKSIPKGDIGPQAEEVNR